MTKDDIRHQIRLRKKACSLAERSALSKKVVARLMNTDSWKNAHTVLLYYSLPDEVDTHELASAAVCEGKIVLLPSVVGDDLELHIFNEKEELVEGAFHIQEPAGNLFTDYDSIDLAIIPGVAFTPNGVRLGRGRGYYDRLLTHLAKTYKIGLCWPFQLLNEIPSEPHDICMNMIISY